MNWHRWLATPTGLATSRPKFGGDAICRSTSVASFWTRELRHSVQRALPLLVGRDRKFADSLLEGRVTSELVSEVDSGARKNQNQIFRGFWMIPASENAVSLEKSTR